MIANELDETFRTGSNRVIVRDSLELLHGLQGALCQALETYAEKERMAPRPPIAGDMIKQVLQEMSDDLYRLLTLAVSPGVMGFKLPIPRRRVVGIDLFTVYLKDRGVLFKVQLKACDFEGDVIGPCDGVIIPLTFSMQPRIQTPL